MHGKTAEVEALALSGREHAADEPAAGLRNDDRVVGEGGGDRLGGLAERARFGPELAAVFRESRTDELGDGRALRGCGEPDRDLVEARAQMPVCSGR
jgi:hypothetical protein